MTLSMSGEARGAHVARRLQPIQVGSHPGGRNSGRPLPPRWFSRELAGDREPVIIPDCYEEAGGPVRNLRAVREMGLAIRDAALAALRDDAMPFLVGGDHSMALGTLAAATHQGRVGVIWVDAHPDFNTPETSPTGNAHGMPLAHACGLGEASLLALFGGRVDPRDVVILGARDIDPAEADLLRSHGITQLTIADLRAWGVDGMVRALAERFGGIPVHLSWDFDVVSSEFFGATGTPVPGGMRPDEAEGLLLGLASSGVRFLSADWVEYDPEKDVDGRCAAIARNLWRAFHDMR